MPAKTRNRFDLICFPGQLEDETPAGQEVIAISGNVRTSEEVSDWRGAHPRWRFVSTPKHASGLNQVEIFFIRMRQCFSLAIWQLWERPAMRLCLHGPPSLLPLEVRMVRLTVKIGGCTSLGGRAAMDDPSLAEEAAGNDVAGVPFLLDAKRQLALAPTFLNGRSQCQAP